jgi:hypothetical protein
MIRSDARLKRPQSAVDEAYLQNFSQNLRGALHASPRTNFEAPTVGVCYWSKADISPRLPNVPEGCGRANHEREIGGLAGR